MLGEVMGLLSRMARENQPQLVRRIYDKAKEYEGVVDLTLGDPDVPTPCVAKEAACRALEENRTKYTANAGILPLREAICADVEKRLGVTYSPDEVCVTTGAMGALYLAAVCLLDPGDEMIIPEPHWPNYTNMVAMCHAVPKYVNFLEAGDPLALARRIEAAVTPKTKAIILNSPSNPTGAVLPFETLEAVAQIAKKYDLWVFSDEVYHTIVFEGACRSILEIPDMKCRTVYIDSVSKRFSMTGFRVGYLCAPQPLAASAAALQENVNACACTPAQYASLAALRHSDELEEEICAVFRQRCRAMARELNRSATLSVEMPVATFYLFIDVRKTGLSSEDFAYGLLEEKHVAVVPGNAFNRAGEGYIRIACTLEEETLVAAARAIVDFADRRCR